MMKKLIITFLVLSFSFSSFAGVVVIANNDVKDAEISKSDIKKMFTAKMKSWPGGGKVKLTILKKGDTREAFIKEMTGLTPSKFKTFWKKLIFTGKGKPPKSFTSEEDLVAYVKKTSGAVGCVSDKTDISGTKKLTVK